MPLATKNGSIIVKDGLLAENCGCCGGWYCCADKACVLDGITSATIQISAANYFRTSYYQISASETGYESAAFLGNALSGTHSLSSVAGSPKSWSKLFSNYLALPNGGQAPNASIHLGSRYDPTIGSSVMMLYMFYYFFARELYQEEYRNPLQWQDIPGGYMGTQPMFNSVSIPCPTFEGTASMTFSAVLNAGYGWATTLTPPTIVSEQGSKDVTVSVEWS
jgi:hypothetical protein